MKIIFRVDDIYLDGSEFEYNLLSIFYQNRIPLTLGVIPFNSDDQPLVSLLDNRTKELLDTGLFEVALHGYKHVKNGLWGEFYGVDYQTQYEWLSKGKKHLESLTGLQIKTLIPPWNASDQNTLNAAYALGFTTISIGHDQRNHNIRHSDITLLPYTVEHLYIFETLFFKIVNALNTMGITKNRIAIILFHPYNILEWRKSGIPYFTGSKTKFGIPLNQLNKTLTRLPRNKYTEYIKIAEVSPPLKLYLNKNKVFNAIYRIFYTRYFKLISFGK